VLTFFFMFVLSAIGTAGLASWVKVTAVRGHVIVAFATLAFFAGGLILSDLPPTVQGLGAYMVGGCQAFGGLAAGAILAALCRASMLSGKKRRKS
jgi:hypothetical protein